MYIPSVQTREADVHKHSSLMNYAQGVMLPYVWQAT